MAGIDIPIGGDLSPLDAVFRELTAEIRGLSAAITRAFGPAAEGARRVSRETDRMVKSTRSGKVGFLHLAQSLTAIGANVANIAVGVRSFKNLKAGAAKAAASIKAMASNPALRRVAIAAAAAGAAILGTVVAVKAVKAAFRTLKSAASLTFRGIKTVAMGAFSAIRGAASGLSRLITGGGFMGGALRLAGVAGAFALATSQLKGAFEAATGFEDMQVSMEQFVGDAEKARALIADLTDFATATPFETKDILGASATLLSAGIRGDVSQITKDLAAVSKDGQKLGELADALGKAFARQKFQTDELNKFLERGINLMPSLAAVTGLTGDALKKAIEEGLRFDQVSEAIARMSREGGQFFGLLERRSKTTTGLISTLKSVWDEVRRAFAQPILDSLKPMITGGIELLNSLRAKAAEVGAAVRDIFMGAFVLIRDGKAMDLLKVGFQLAVAGAIDLLMRGLRSAVAFLATALPPIFETAVGKLKDPAFWDGVGMLFKGMGQALAAEIATAMNQTEKASFLASGSRNNMSLGKGMIRSSGNAEDPAEVLGKALADGLAAAAKAGLGPSSPGFRAAKADFKALLDTVSAEVAKLRAQTAIPGVSSGATGEGPGTRFDGMDTAAAGGARASIFAGNLARVGGGGFGMLVTPMVSQQRTTNQLLRSIDRKTGTAPAGVALAFSAA